MEYLWSYLRNQFLEGIKGIPDQPIKPPTEAEQSVQDAALRVHLPSSSSSQLSQSKEILAREQPQDASIVRVKEMFRSQVVPMSPVSEISTSPMSPVSEAASTPGSSLHEAEANCRSFAYVTRNMENVQEIIDAHGRDDEVAELVVDLMRGDCLSILERYQEEDPMVEGLSNAVVLERDALKAFSQGEIQGEQYCSLAYLATLMKMYPGEEIYVQPLFHGQSEDGMAKQMVEQGLYRSGPAISNFFTRQESQEIYRDFFQSMKQTALSEQWFFYVPASPPDSRRLLRDIVEANIGLRIFDYFVFSGESFRMVPSFSMIQTVVRAYGKENAVDPAPMGGPATRKDLRDDIENNTRVLAIPLSDYPCPPVADGFEVDPLDFLRHDVYHNLVSSSVPKSCRKETGILADMAAQLQRELSPEEARAAYLETFQGRMVDVDFVLFREGIRTTLEGLPQDLTEGEYFLLELERQAYAVTKQRMQLKLDTLPSREEREKLKAPALESLRKWDQIQAQIQSGITFDELFEELYASSSTEIARSMYQSGFLERFDLSEEGLSRVKALAPLIEPGLGFSQDALLSNQLLLTHLLAKKPSEQ